MIEDEGYYTAVFLLTATPIGVLAGFSLPRFATAGAFVGFAGGVVPTFLLTPSPFYGR